jgi:hypothetical protein
MPITVLSCEAKMRMLAASDASLQAFFGTPPAVFRWFDRQLPPGYIDKGTCMRVRRVSTQSQYVQEGPIAMEMIRFQFDAIDFSPETARAAARALEDWFGTVDFMSDAQFTSPSTTPNQFPNFQINQRSSIEQPLTGAVYYVESQDFRVFNNSNF